MSQIMDAGPVLFLFDIDGTLIKGGTAVHREAFAHAFRAVYGLPLDLDGVPAGGRTDTWLLIEPLRRNGLSETEIRAGMPRAFDEMQVYVEERLGDLRDRVLPGVPKVLDHLRARGHRLGLLTGNLSRIAMAKMRQAGLATYFDTGGFGEESDIRSDLVPVALRKWGEATGEDIPAWRTVVVGDTPLDVEAGKVHGTRTVVVATGPYAEAQLRETDADLVLPSLEDATAASQALLQLAAATGRTGR